MERREEVEEGMQTSRSDMTQLSKVIMPVD
jgi:hypothetical protein